MLNLRFPNMASYSFPGNWKADQKIHCKHLVREFIFSGGFFGNQLKGTIMRKFLLLSALYM